jgi:hypothetical protein
MIPISYVSSIQDFIIRLRIYDKHKADSIKALGGRKTLLSKEWTISYQNENDLVQIVKSLNELGICFVGSTHGWPPSEILAKLKDDGVLDIGWKEIVWVKKGEYIVLLRHIINFGKNRDIVLKI